LSAIGKQVGFESKHGMCEWHALRPAKTQPTNEPTNESTNQRANQATNEPTKQPNNQRTNQLTNFIEQSSF